jgi:hypothetical protein
MKILSKKTIVTSLISICLWIIGSIFLFRVSNGKIIILLTAIGIVAGIFSLIIKDQRADSEL